MPRLLILLLLIAVSLPAHADWAQVGAAYKCDHTAKTFQIVATMASSDENSTIAAPADFTPFDLGSYRAVACQLGRIAIAAIVAIGGGRDRGLCAANGSAGIYVLAVENQISLRMADLGSPCSDLPGITSLKIKANAKGATLTICKGIWDDEPRFTDVQCTDTQILDDQAAT